MNKIENYVFEIELNDIKDKFNYREKDTNKGDYGYVGIIGGSIEYSGAIKLANMSTCSLRSGAGVVRLIVPKSITKSIMPYLLEQTIFQIDDENGKMRFETRQIDSALNKLKAIAIGMGWNRNIEYEKILKHILVNYNIPVVIDADGLNTLSSMDLDILKSTRCKVILTPHLKEFERLSKKSIEEIKGSSINLAKEFAKKYNVILLLKGPTTIITDGKEVYLVKRGCPGMATAGSGDVLSGILVGLLGYNDADLLTVATGAYLNGISGEIAEKKYTDISQMAHDTIESIPDAIKYIRENNK
jgi:hydroxyethylthiazole kinase-like uncharacterized protein yjeF